MLGHAAALDVHIRVVEEEAGPKDREVIDAFAFFVGNAARDAERMQRTIPELPADERPVLREQGGGLVVGSSWGRRSYGKAKEHRSDSRK